MAKLRVLLLTQWFDPEPTFKGLVFARELVRQGFEVEVLTGFPNYPGGAIYPGYRIKLLQREVIDGVQITRVPLFPSHGQSVIGRILNYVSFSVSAFFYGVLGARLPSVVYAYHPPLTVGIASVFIKFFRRIPVVYDVQDMWPDTLRATGMLNSVMALRLVGRVCRWVYRRVDHIVVLSPGFRRLLVERGVPESKLSVIYNWADEASLAQIAGPLPAEYPLAKRYFRILFAGNMGKAQGLNTVLSAASLLQLRGSRVRWVLLGSGVELDALKAEVAKKNLNNVVFLPAVPMAEVGSYLYEADALLVHLRKDPLFEITIPSKTQAYMSAGKPLLMAVDGDAADLVRLSEGGIVAESDNPEALANAADKLASMLDQDLARLGSNSKSYYKNHLGLVQGVRQFGHVFCQLAQFE
jgi:glycosyltransferase involved in cell wall biosynthesis